MKIMIEEENHVDNKGITAESPTKFRELFI